MIAEIYRFWNNSKNAENNSSSGISVDEFENAENLLHRLIQQKSFSGRIYTKIRSLRPFKYKNCPLKAKTNIIKRNDKKRFCYLVILLSTILL